MFYTTDYPKEIDPLQFIDVTKNNPYNADATWLLFEKITSDADLAEGVVYMETILADRDYDDHGRDEMMAIYRIKNRTPRRSGDGYYTSSTLYGISYTKAKWGDINQWEDFPPMLKKLRRKEHVIYTYHYLD